MDPKVPARGSLEQFGPLAAAALRCEALTMQLIRRETSVHMQDVMAFDSTVKNELSCSFILMNFIRRKALYDCRFDKSISNDELRANRTRTLKDVACVMVELGQFSFTTG